ncbi:hypothetical protein AUR64_03220 [Haloprofundus marisrubri]|uniref:Uncharacterized protein n=1 Tax=Haloprofundus marisrubri TaxID=1514971 RepID=A0A0W1RDM8_9EURY|nr:hypothetical protein [Haloprofundus marisrubri]KTG11528.1 hypothetical protein AUR64_03220 [Haloprofundus marisrubri]
MKSTTPRRRTLAVLTLALLVCSGCLTVQPTVSVQTSDGPTFKSVTTNDEWGTSGIDASVTLSSAATTEQGVTKVSVITAEGESFYTTSVDTGQTSVSVVLPTNQTAQLYAVNTVNGTVVARQNVTISGTTVP